MTGGWSWYVIALVASNIVGCAWLLWWTARRRPGDPKPEDTSHVWDGDITEYNKPLPRWWINLFYLTIAFSIGYLLWYPGLGNFAGYGRWSSQSEHAQVKAAEDAKLRETFRPYDGQSIAVLARDAQAISLGRSIYNNTCATCHGSSAQGAIGYPNLSDDIWHWGGSPEQVLATVLDGREGVMPEWGKVLTGIGGENAVMSVVSYVRSFSHERPQGDYFAAQGKKLYEGVCVACHGADGKGNQTLGAPDLTDDYWLYGDSTQSLTRTIMEGRHGVMPAHRALLGETRARLVAAYVWSLSNQDAGARATASACDRAMSSWTTPTLEHPPRPLAQRVGAILWPSFFAAGVSTMVFFAFVDPLALRDMTFPALPMTRGLGYSIGFFMFWVATAASSLFTWILLRPASRFNRALPPDR